LGGPEAAGKAPRTAERQMPPAAEAQTQELAPKTAQQTQVLLYILYIGCTCINYSCSDQISKSIQLTSDACFANRTSTFLQYNLKASEDQRPIPFTISVSIPDNSKEVVPPILKEWPVILWKPCNDQIALHMVIKSSLSSTFTFSPSLYSHSKAESTSLDATRWWQIALVGSRGADCIGRVTRAPAFPVVFVQGRKIEEEPLDSTRSDQLPLEGSRSLAHLSADAGRSSPSLNWPINAASAMARAHFSRGEPLDQEEASKRIMPGEIGGRGGFRCFSSGQCSFRARFIVFI
jgi:hypothetical protein